MTNIVNNKQAIDYHLSVFPRIYDFCIPLKNHFGIDFFSYMQVYNDGSYFLISNNHNLANDYFKLELGEMFIKDEITNNRNYKLFLWPKYPEGKMMSTYAMHGLWHGLSFVDIKTDYIEGISFLSNKNNCRVTEFYLKYSNQLSVFIEEFKKHFASEIYKGPQSSIAMFNQLRKLVTNDVKLYNQTPNIKNFLDDIGYKKGNFKIDNKLINLTSSELECLEFLSQGFSVKEIARRSSRGHRTVETLLNRIKTKTEISGSGSKSQLINLYNQKLKF